MNVQTDIAPPGSSLYYSLLYCSESLRPKILALREFYQSVQKIPLTSQNPSLAQIKFQWWREELVRMKSKKAQHPALKILQNDFEQHAELENILDAFSHDVQISLYDNNNDRDKFYVSTAGVSEKLLYPIEDPQILHSLSHLGVFIQKVSHLRDLRTSLSRGKIYFSGEQLLLHRVTLYELSQLKLTENIYALFQTAARHLSADYHEHVENLRRLPVAAKSAKPTLILAKIYQKLLDEIAQTNFPLLTHKISLTPFRKWWIAWTV